MALAVNRIVLLRCAVPTVIVCWCIYDLSTDRTHDHRLDSYAVHTRHDKAVRLSASSKTHNRCVNFIYVSICYGWLSHVIRHYYILPYDVQRPPMTCVKSPHTDHLLTMCSTTCDYSTTIRKKTKQTLEICR